MTHKKMTCWSPDLTRATRSTSCLPQSGRKKREVDTLFRYRLGFNLDGMPDFKAVSHLSWLREGYDLYVHPDPTIVEFEETNRIRELTPAENHLKISGNHLDSGK